MVRLRRGQYLVCFYCGKRTSLRFDGATRQFDCSKCEATNYLDENGEITDPPVATERESTPRQFAVPQAASAATPHHIFCDRCIKNQRLFTASLAQYLPSDPSDPDYERLEKEYYRFRRNLETRYPQVCADCEGKVRGAIKQASYAARTDHLRRMVERTRNIRQGGSSAKTTLDWVDLAGKALWWGGLLVQMLWHFKLIVHILQIPDPDGGMRDPDAGNPIGDAAAKLQPLADKLPGVALLLKASLVSGILSAWWNPQFVKVARGFTRHLLGFTQWYSFQGLIVFFRFVYSSVAEVVDGQTQSAQLSAHLIMAVFMIMMYNFARRSIKVNTAPLFGPSDGTASPKQPPSPVRNNQPRNIKSFAEELDEALVSAASSPVKPPAPSAQYTAPQSRDGPFQRRTPAPNRDFNLRPTSAPRSPGMNGLSLSDTPERSAPQSDEMDWSPTVPPPPMPRAFQPSSKPGTRAFGASPTTSENSPFWYKVPAAPVNPAHKLRNPPNAPMIRPNLSADKNGFGNGNGKKGDIFFRGAASKAKREEDEEQRRRGVEFRHQSFFAERKDDGDANSLADMLGASFSIESEAGDAQSVVDEPFHGQQNAAASQSARPTSAPAPARAPTWEFALLNALLAVYLISSFVDLPYHANVQVVALCLGGILALRIMGREQTVSPLRSALGVAELACLCTVGWNTWIGEEGGEDDLNSWMGVGAFAAMVVHQGIDLMTTR